jgi:hypothetical protein
VTVTSTAKTFSWGRPNGNAAVVARSGDATSPAVIFGYAKGAAMPGLVAPGRRMGFFLSNTTAGALTTNGWSLFDAAVRWAGGP